MKERKEEEALISFIDEKTTTPGDNAAKAFEEIAARLVDLWVENLNRDPVWPPGFQGHVAELLRRERGRRGFQAYLGECETYALRSSGDGFIRSCYYRSNIQILIEEFIPLADMVHPEDTDELDEIDAIYTRKADEIPPIPPEEIPSWVPESHWWWRAPTRHDMSQQEINEKLYDYHPEDWETR